jgi:hypothetical protein
MPITCIVLTCDPSTTAHLVAFSQAAISM